MTLPSWARRLFARPIRKVLRGRLGVEALEDRAVWLEVDVRAPADPLGVCASRARDASQDPFELPTDIVEDYGYPPLTEQAKRKILAGNLARLHGIDLEAKAAELGAPL